MPAAERAKHFLDIPEANLVKFLAGNRLKRACRVAGSQLRFRIACHESAKTLSTNVQLIGVDR
jgi:hypothetical protein